MCTENKIREGLLFYSTQSRHKVKSCHICGQLTEKSTQKEMIRYSV